MMMYNFLLTTKSDFETVEMFSALCTCNVKYGQVILTNRIFCYAEGLVPTFAFLVSGETHIRRKTPIVLKKLLTISLAKLTRLDRFLYGI